jgi:hypothetical protein
MSYAKKYRGEHPQSLIMEHEEAQRSPRGELGRLEGSRVQGSLQGNLRRLEGGSKGASKGT